MCSTTPESDSILEKVDGAHVSKEVASQIASLAAVTPSELELAIWYGSRDPRSDVDLLLVCAESEVQRFAVGRLDLIALASAELLQRIRLLDPVFTEPILTGELVAGSAEALARYRHEIAHTPVARSALDYLDMQSFRRMSHAIELAAGYDYSGDVAFLRRAADEAAWAHSYRAFATAYRERQARPFSFEDLRSVSSCTPAFEKAMRARELGSRRENVPEEDVRALLTPW